MPKWFFSNLVGEFPFGNKTLKIKINVAQYLSYIVSFAIYQLLFNWKVAAVLTVGIGFHEYGHLLAAKISGYKTGGMYLIPFFGGLALHNGPIRKYDDKAYIAIAGPLAGAFLTVSCYFLYVLTGSSFFGGAAYWMAIINLFNLIPFSFLDGGQISESITYSISETLGCFFMIGTLIIGSIILWHFNPFITGIMLFYGGKSAINNFNQWKMRRAGFSYALTPRPISMNKREILRASSLYILTALSLLGLIILCVKHGIGFTSLMSR